MRAAILLAVVAIAAVMAMPPAASQVQSGHGDNVQHCDSLTVTTSAGLLSAGTFHYCVFYPDTVSTVTSRFNIVQSVSGPPVSGGSPSVVRNFFPTGCSEVSNTGPRGTGFANFATQWSWITTVDMTSPQCRVQMSVEINAGGSKIYDTFLNANVHSLDLPGDVRNYLCDATASTTTPIPVAECTAPSMFSFECRSKPTNTVSINCDTPSVRNYLCNSSTYAFVGGDIPPSDCTAPQITVCQEAAPCHHVLSGAVDGGGDTNVTVGEMVVPPDSTRSLWPLWLALAIFAVGVLPAKRNQGVIAFSGLLFMFAAAATDLAELGLTLGQAEATRVILALLGLFVLIVSGVVIQDEERERRRTAKAEAEADS